MLILFTIFSFVFSTPSISLSYQGTSESDATCNDWSFSFIGDGETGVWFVSLGLDCYDGECKVYRVYKFITNTVPNFDGMSYKQVLDSETQINAISFTGIPNADLTTDDDYQESGKGAI